MIEIVGLLDCKSFDVYEIVVLIQLLVKSFIVPGFRSYPVTNASSALSCTIGALSALTAPRPLPNEAAFRAISRHKDRHPFKP